MRYSQPQKNELSIFSQVTLLRVWLCGCLCMENVSSAYAIIKAQNQRHRQQHHQDANVDGAQEKPQKSEMKRKRTKNGVPELVWKGSFSIFPVNTLEVLFISIQHKSVYIYFIKCGAQAV